MAKNDNMMHVTQLAISIFKGENYEFWSIKDENLVQITWRLGFSREGSS
jgi:hypothetical protein